MTILCPQFSVGANTDVWDEALGGGGSGGGGGGGGGSGEKRRTKAESSEGQAEAGKVWERGRNWTSVVVEVVPAGLESAVMLAPERGERSDGGDGGLDEDEDILEIPVFVRVEYEADAAADEAGEKATATAAAAGVPGDKDRHPEKEREKRELAYWCVLGIGRIA